MTILQDHVGQLQNGIRTQGLEAFCSPRAIAMKRHTKYPNLVMLKYDQIESPMGDPMVQLCRGIILDETDNYKVVSFPFTKFFNYGEGHAAPIDWKSARVAEKLDGSIMTLYWYNGEWQVASNGLPDASGEVNKHSSTFAELFWEVWNSYVGDKKYHLPTQRDICIMFELMTPHNKVIVQHSESRLVCIGARNINTYEEFNPISVQWYFNYEIPTEYRLRTLEDSITAAKALNPMQSEGYVVTDANWNRVKVKSPQYVALSHMKDQFSARRMLEVVRANESDEFLTYFPEMKPTYDEVKGKFDSLVLVLEAKYAEIKDVTDRKAFALEAIKTPLSGALFAVHQKKVGSIRQFLSEMSIAGLEKAI